MTSWFSPLLAHTNVESKGTKRLLQHMFKCLISTKTIWERKTTIKPGNKTWQNTTEFEVCMLLTSAIASEDKWVFITRKTKHTHAVVSQDAVRHLVTCSNKPWYFPPTETTFNIYKSKNRPSKIKSTRNLIRFHCSASPVTDHADTTPCKHRQTQYRLKLPAAAGKGEQDTDYYTLPSAHRE